MQIQYSNFCNQFQYLNQNHLTKLQTSLSSKKNETYSQQQSSHMKLNKIQNTQTIYQQPSLSYSPHYICQNEGQIEEMKKILSNKNFQNSIQKQELLKDENEKIQKYTQQTYQNQENFNNGTNQYPSSKLAIRNEVKRNRYNNKITKNYLQFANQNDKIINQQNKSYLNQYSQYQRNPLQIKKDIMTKKMNNYKFIRSKQHNLNTLQQRRYELQQYLHETNYQNQNNEQNLTNTTTLTKNNNQEKTKRIQKKLKQSNERNQSQDYIIQQYKKYKKLKQKLNKSHNTPKITSSVLINNQMNQFQEMNAQQEESTFQKQDYFQQNQSSEYVKEDSKLYSQIESNSLIDYIFPTNNSNNFSMIDTILENDEKKKQIQNIEVNKLLDLNGCSDNESLKKLIQMFSLKLNQKSEKIRFLKNKLKEKNQKIKILQKEQNGSQEQTDYEFEDEDEFSDYDDEELFEENMNQEDSQNEDSQEQLEEDSQSVDEEQKYSSQSEEDNILIEEEKIKVSQNKSEINEENITLFDDDRIQINSNNIQIEQDNKEKAQKLKNVRKSLNKNQFFPLINLIKQCSINLRESKNEGDSKLSRLILSKSRQTSDPNKIIQYEDNSQKNSLDQAIKIINQLNSEDFQDQNNTQQLNNDIFDLRKKSQSV